MRQRFKSLTVIENAARSQFKRILVIKQIIYYLATENEIAFLVFPELRTFQDVKRLMTV
jgi:hypothetical protein